MKKIVVMLLFVLCAGVVLVQPVLAAEEAAQESVAVQDLVNVNVASLDALKALPGIGQVTAERIVAYRTEHGPFQSVDDLVQVKGVGEKVLEKIRTLVTI